MAWVRIDDGFARHPKVVAAGPLAMAMQVAALCYCNRELTDGFVPRAVAKTLLDFDIDRADGTRYTVAWVSGHAGDDMSSEWIISLMVEAGMWDEVPGGYRIHDYHDYQPSKEQVLQEREGNRKRQAAWRERNAVTNSVSNDATNGPVTGAPYPVPVPEPDPETEGANAPNARAKEPADFLAFWDEYPTGHGSRVKTLTAWRKVVRKADVPAVMAGLAAWKACERWERGYIVAAQTWLAEKRWLDPPPEAAPRASPGNGRHDPNAGLLRVVTPPTPEEVERTERIRREALAKSGETAEERWRRLHPEIAGPAPRIQRS